MLKLIRSPWGVEFAELVKSAHRNLVLCSPYVGRSPCEVISRCLRSSDRTTAVAVDVITNLSPENLLSGSTDAGALYDLARDIATTTIRFVAAVHAKVYVADENAAVITSANMTDAGLHRNLEYGVCVTDPLTVRAIRRDITDYGSIGTLVSAEELSRFATVAEKLRATRARAERSIRARYRREFECEYEAATVESIRIRSSGRTANAVFAETILFLLLRGPMTTAQLHRSIKDIHPDFCDDTVDRVIDGRHFGKKWKHAVRNAQQHLKRTGQIELRGELWYNLG